MDNDTTATDTTMADNTPLVDTCVVDTCVAEPEETLEISSQGSSHSRQLLATYRYGDLQRSYYWDGNYAGGQLSVYDENGICLKKHNLTEKYGIVWMDDSQDGIVAKLYSHHVYFVGGGVGSGGVYYVIFYLTPQEGNGIHVIEDLAQGYEFQENSVRVQRLTCTNADTAEHTYDYEYEESWETIPLR